MTKPTILAVDDDRLVLAAIVRDLNSEYGEQFRVLPASSGAEALSLLARIALRDEPVALIAADQRMPKMTGIELLEQARVHAPTAKFVLLTAYADTDVAIKAISATGSSLSAIRASSESASAPEDAGTTRYCSPYPLFRSRTIAASTSRSSSTARMVGLVIDQPRDDSILPE